MELTGTGGMIKCECGRAYKTKDAVQCFVCDFSTIGLDTSLNVEELFLAKKTLAKEKEGTQKEVIL